MATETKPNETPKEILERCTARKAKAEGERKGSFVRVRKARREAEIFNHKLDTAEKIQADADKELKEATRALGDAQRAMAKK